MDSPSFDDFGVWDPPYDIGVWDPPTTTDNSVWDPLFSPDFCETMAPIVWALGLQKLGGAHTL